jgi:hypothetical protein
MLLAWSQSGDWTYLLAALGFVALTVVWSQVPLVLSLSFKKHVASLRPLNREFLVLALLGMVLVIVALLVRVVRDL